MRPEQFESELERLNATLVTENHAIQNENRQLALLLKEHESTLESVMAKFRAFAHSTQQHELELARHYEQLLLEREHAVPTYASFSVRGLPERQQPQAVPTLSMPAEDAAAAASHLADPSSAPVAIVPLAELDRLSGLLRAAFRSLNGEDPEAAADEDALDPAAASIEGGGYVALMHGGASEDRALETDIELEQLRRENEELRRMLRIAEADEASLPTTR